MRGATDCGIEVAKPVMPMKRPASVAFSGSTSSSSAWSTAENMPMPSRDDQRPREEEREVARSAMSTMPTAMIAPPRSTKSLRRRNRSERKPPPIAPAVTASTPTPPRVRDDAGDLGDGMPRRSAKKNAVNVVLSVRPK